MSTALNFPCNAKLLEVSLSNLRKPWHKSDAADIFAKRPVSITVFAKNSSTHSYRSFKTWRKIMVWRASARVPWFRASLWSTVRLLESAKNRQYTRNHNVHDHLIAVFYGCALTMFLPKISAKSKCTLEKICEIVLGIPSSPRDAFTSGLFDGEFDTSNLSEFTVEAKLWKWCNSHCLIKASPFLNCLNWSFLFWL